MEMNKLQLQQAAEALENLRGAHHLLIEWYPKTVPTREQLSLQNRLLEDDRELYWELMVAIPVSALYAAQYAGEPHRYSRLGDVLNRCCIIHGNLSESFIIFTGETDAKYSARAYQQFKTAGKILNIAQKSLKGLAAERSVLYNDHRYEDANCVRRRGDDFAVEQQEQEAAAPTPAEYLRDRSRYEWHRQALCLKSYLTQIELDSLVVEKLRSPFQRFLRIYFPTYGSREDFEKVGEEEVEKQDDVDAANEQNRRRRSNRPLWGYSKPRRTAEQSDEESAEDDERDNQADNNVLFYGFDSINAVWHSMLAAGYVQTRREEEYRKIYRAAISTKAKVLATPRKRVEPRFLNAVSLAKGLRSMDMWLGIIFEDDPHTIVWPLGKSPAGQEREVVVYCNFWVGVPDGYCSFAYQGIKFLDPGKSAVRPPRVDLAFSDASGKLYSWEKSRLCEYDDEIGEMVSGPVDARFLCSILAIARQSSPAYKPFPFLQLPAELRNKVYEVYLSQEDRPPPWTRRRLELEFDGGIPVPELCQTSRQLLSEVLPLYLAQKAFRVDICTAQPFLKLGAQPILNELLRFHHVQFAGITFHPARGVLLEHVGLILKDETPGFAINIDPYRYLSRSQPERDPHPIILALLEHLKRLITILIEDTRTPGVGLADVSAIYEFLYNSRRYRPEWLDGF